MKPKSNFQLSVGGSSILMIFVVLCLTTFGMLSYVTANADSKISTKNAETVQNYYKANLLVQSKLDQVDSALLTAKSDAKQAVNAGTCTGLKNYDFYKARAGFETALKSGTSKEQKIAAYYRFFAKSLVTRCHGVGFESRKEEDDAFNIAFSAEADQSRQIHVRLTVNPYASVERYKINSEKLITIQPDDVDSDETLQLWQGSSVGQ